jgi:hypothetical protein
MALSCGNAKANSGGDFIHEYRTALRIDAETQQSTRSSVASAHQLAQSERDFETKLRS